MDYKVLVEFYVPEIEEKFEAYIPINKTIGEISVLLLNKIRDEYEYFSQNGRPKLYNRRNYRLYHYNEIVRGTDIRNGTELVLIA